LYVVAVALGEADLGVVDEAVDRGCGDEGGHAATLLNARAGKITASLLGSVSALLAH